MFSHLNDAVSQDLQVSFPHQGFAFHVVRILAEGPRVQKLYSDSETTVKAEGHSCHSRVPTHTYFILHSVMQHVCTSEPREAARP